MASKTNSLKESAPQLRNISRKQPGEAQWETFSTEDKDSNEISGHLTSENPLSTDSDEITTEKPARSWVAMDGKKLYEIPNRLKYREVGASQMKQPFVKDEKDVHVEGTKISHSKIYVKTSIANPFQNLKLAGVPEIHQVDGCALKHGERHYAIQQLRDNLQPEGKPTFENIHRVVRDVASTDAKEPLLVDNNLISDDVKQMVKVCIELIDRGDYAGVNRKLNLITNPQQNKTICQLIVRDAYEKSVNNFSKVLYLGTLLENVERKFLVYDALFHEITQNNHLFFAQVNQLLSEIQQSVLEKIDSTHPFFPDVNKLSGQLELLKEKITLQRRDEDGIVKECTQFMTEGRFSGLIEKLDQVIDPDLAKNILMNTIFALYGNERKNLEMVLDFLTQVNNSDAFKIKSQGLVKKLETWVIDNLTKICSDLIKQGEYQEVEDLLKHMTLSVKKAVICNLVNQMNRGDNGFTQAINWSKEIRYDIVSRFLIYETLSNTIDKTACKEYSNLINLMTIVKEKVSLKLPNIYYLQEYPTLKKDAEDLSKKLSFTIIKLLTDCCVTSLERGHIHKAASQLLNVVDEDLNQAIIQAIVARIYKGNPIDFRVVTQFADIFPLNTQKYFIYESLFTVMKQFDQLDSSNLILLFSRHKTDLLHRIESASDSTFRERVIVLGKEINSFVIEKEVKKISSLLVDSDMQALISQLNLISDEDLTRSIVQGVAEQFYSNNSSNLKLLAQLGSATTLDFMKRFFVYESALKVLERHKHLLSVEFFRIVSRLNLEIVEGFEVPHYIRKEAQDLRERLLLLVRLQAITECVNQIKMDNVKGFNERLNMIVDSPLMQAVTEEVIERVYTENVDEVEKIINFAQKISNKERSLIIYQALFQTLQKNERLLNIELFKILSNVERILDETDKFNIIDDKAKKLVVQLRKLIGETAINDGVTLVMESNFQGINTKLNIITDSSLLQTIILGIVDNSYGRNIDNFSKVIEFGENLKDADSRFIVYKALFGVMEKNHHLNSKQLFQLASHISTIQSSKNSPSLVSEAKALLGSLKTLVRKFAIEEYISLINDGKTNAIEQELKPITEPALVESILQGIVLQVYQGKLGDLKLVMSLCDDIISKEQQRIIYQSLIEAIHAYPRLPNSPDLMNHFSRLQKAVDDLPQISSVVKQQVWVLVSQVKQSLIEKTIKECVNAAIEKNFEEVNEQLSSLDDLELENSVIQGMVAQIYGNKLSSFAKILELGSAIKDSNQAFWVYNSLFQIMRDQDHLDGLEVNEISDKLERLLALETNVGTEVGKKVRALCEDVQPFIDRNKMLPLLDELREKVSKISATVASQFSTPSMKRSKFESIKTGVENELRKMMHNLDTVHLNIRDKYLSRFNVLSEQAQQLQIKLDEVNDVFSQRKRQVEAQITKNDKLLAITKLKKVTSPDLLHLQEVVELDGADVNAEDEMGWSPLHHASFKGHKTMVLYLLAREAQLNSITSEGNTPLHNAALSGQGVVVRILVGKGVQVIIENNEGLTPRQLALKKFEHIAEFLLNAELFEVVKQGNLRKVEHYFNIDADINARDHRDWTPLHYAAFNGHTLIAQYLLKVGAGINARSIKDHWSVIHCAAYSGNLPIIKMLAVKGHTEFDVKLGESVEKPLQGATPLHIASWRGHTDVVEYFLKDISSEKGYHANFVVDEKSSVQAWTALHYASAAGHNSTLNLLLQNNASIIETTKAGDNALHIAARYGRFELVKILVQRGLPLAAKGESGWTSLHYASQSGEFQLVEWIVKQTNDLIHTRNALGAKAVHIAAQHGQFEAVSFFLSKASDINDQDGENWTPLHYAALGNDKEQAGMVAFLLKEGGKVNLTTALTNSQFCGASPIHIAAQYGYYKTVETLVKYGEHVDARDIQPRQWTVLHYATDGGLRKQPEVIAGVTLKPLRCGHGKVITFLVSQGAQRDVPSSEATGDKPIHIAAEEGHTGIVKLLIKTGSPIDSANKQDWTPLHYAAKSGYLDVVQLLARNNANKRALTNDGKEPMHFAMQGRHEAVIKFFLEELGVNELDNRKRTTLHYAVEMGESKWVKFLLDRGANANAQDKDHVQPLHLATKKGYFHVTKQLIEHKAAVNGLDHKGQASLHYAASRRNYEHNRLKIVKYLVDEHDADVNLMDKYSEMPIHYAALDGHTLVLEYFANMQWDPTTMSFPLGKDNWTLLHYAAKGGHLDNVKFLIEFYMSEGIKINEDLTDDGETALDVADQEDNQEIKHYLERMQDQQDQDEYARERNRRSIGATKTFSLFSVSDSSVKHSVKEEKNALYIGKFDEVLRFKRAGSSTYNIPVPPTRKSELIELFLIDPVGNKQIKPNQPIKPGVGPNAFDATAPKGFAEHFSLFLERTPNVLSGSKQEFLSHLFYGSVMTLPHTELMKELGIKKIFYKTVSDQTIKLFFVIEKDGKSRVVFNVVTSVNSIGDAQKTSNKELTEIANLLKISLEDMSSYETEGKIYQVKNKELFVKDLEVIKADKSNSNTELDLKGKLSELLSTFDKMNIADGDFIEVTKNSKVKTLLESKIENLSSANIDSVKKYSTEFSEDMVKIYYPDANKSRKQFSTLEAGIHAFYYGALALNFKYRYELDINIERISGKGYVDLIFLSRHDNINGKNWQAFPIVVEFKADLTSTVKALDQIAGTGYLYSLGLRTVASQAVELGVNSHTLDDAVAAKIAPIPQSKGFIKQFLDTPFALTEDIIKSELGHLFFSFSNLAIKKKEERYLNGLVLGEILSAGDGIKKFIFLHEDPELKDKLSTFILKGEDTKPWIILNIIEKGTEIKKNFVLPSELKENKEGAKIIQVDIEVDSTAKDGFSSEIPKRTTGNEETYNYYYQKISIKQDVVINADYQRNDKLMGELKPIGSFDAQKLFKGNIEENAMKDLSEKLKPLTAVINSESDFQAVIQGLFWEKSSDDKILKVFCELNPSKEGRIDLVVLQLSKGAAIKEDNLILMELKYDPAAKPRKTNPYLKDAEKQWPKYIHHLKSITDLSKATVISAVFVKQSGEVLRKVHLNVIVPHTSPALKPLPSPIGQFIPPLELHESMPDGSSDKRPPTDASDEKNKKRKVDVICSSSKNRGKRSTPLKPCIFKLKSSDNQPGDARILDSEAKVTSLDETKIADLNLDANKISQVDGEALLQHLKDAPEAERNHLIEITSKAKATGSEIIANDELNRAITKLTSEQKLQSDANKVERVMEKINSGKLIEDLAGRYKGDLKGIAIGPQLLAEAIDNFQKLSNTETPDKSVKNGSPKLSETQTPDKPLKNGSPFDKSYRYLNKINLGIMGKDLVGKILSGDEKSLAIMGGLIIGDKAAEKVAEKMANKGIKLAEAGKYLKGNLLKVSAPILGSVTSGFQIYSLVSNVNQLKDLSKTCSKTEDSGYENKKCTIDKSVTVAGIVGDSISLAATAVTVGMQAFRLISMGLKAAAGSTGPIGIAIIVIDVLANIAVQIFVAVKQVESIELLIRLTGSERFREGVRGFFGMEISQYLKNLMQIKQGNNALVRNIVDFLKNNFNIEKYVIPATYLVDHNCRTVERNQYQNDNKWGCIAATIFSLGLGALPCALIKETVTECDKKLENHPNNRVFLHSKQSFTVDRAVPDSSGQGENIFCISSSSDGIESRYTYRCDNAIGVQYPYNRMTPHYTLIDLKTGNDEAFGSLYNPNIFLINEGEKNFRGGNKDDLFILQAAPVNGRLNGLEGDNTLVLDKNFLGSNPVTVDLNEGHLRSGGSHLSIENLKVIVGREAKTENIIAGCNTMSIDGQGGYSANNFDVISIPKKSNNCKYRLNIKVNANTKVINDALYGTFSYSIPSSGDFSVDLNLEGTANHFFLLNDLAKNIVTVWFDTISKDLTIVNQQGRKFVQKLKYLIAGEDLYSQPKFSTQDQIFIQINKVGAVQGFIPIEKNSSRSVEGLRNYPNLFLIEGGNGILKGGEKDDVFILQNESFGGTLDGRAGSNMLVFENEFMPGNSINVDLVAKSLTAGYKTAILNRINVVLGRKNEADTVVAACDTQLINGQGGNSYHWDEIKISDNFCSYQLHLPVKSFTKVVNKARKGNFRYELYSEGNVEIQVSPSSEANHFFLFDDTARTLGLIVFNKDTQTVSFFNRHGKILDQRLIPNGVNDSSYELFQFITRDPLEIKIDREGGIQGVAKLNEETPTISGLLSHPNTFIIEGGNKFITGRGGNSNDLFILEHTTPGGILEGEGGNDILMLKQTFAPGQNVEINLGLNGYLKTSSSSNVITLSGIKGIVGRYNESESISVSCDTLAVESQGGTSYQFDEIVIPDNVTCEYSLTIRGEKYTRVTNYASRGKFSYTIPKEGKFISELHFTEGNNHYFLLENTLSELKHLEFDSAKSSLSFSNKQGGHFTQVMKPLNDLDDFYAQPRFTTQDNFEIKVSREGNFVASLKTGEAAKNIVRDYSVLANQLQTTLLFRSDSGNDLIHIGVNSTLDVLTNSPCYKSHLVGNGGENIFVIATNDLEILSEKQPLVSIPEVVIYNFNTGETMDTLDLSPIIRSIRQTNSSRYVPEIQQDGNDLCILIKSNLKLITTVRLKDILLNKQEETLQIVLSQVRMQLKQSGNPKKRSVNWSFKPVPLEIKRDTEILLLTSDDIEDNMDITELKTDSLHYDFTYSDSDLIVTNIFSDGVKNRDRLTIVLKDYSNEPLLQTLKMQFPDKQIELAEQTNNFVLKNYTDIKKTRQDAVYTDVVTQFSSREKEQHMNAHSNSNLLSLNPVASVALSKNPKASSKPIIDRKGGDLFHALPAGSQRTSSREVSSYSHYQYGSLSVEESEPRNQTFNEESSQSYSWGHISNVYVISGVLVTALGGFVVSRLLRVNAGEPNNVMLNVVAAAIPLLPSGEANSKDFEKLKKSAAAETVKYHVKQVKSRKTRFSASPVTAFPLNDGHINNLLPQTATPLVPSSHTASATQTIASNFKFDTVETFALSKWLLGMFGKRSAVNRINRSEELLARNINDSCQLDWAEKQLKIGIASYGSEQEKSYFKASQIKLLAVPSIVSATVELGDREIRFLQSSDILSSVANNAGFECLS